MEPTWSTENTVKAVRAQLLVTAGTDYGASDERIAELIRRASAYVNLRHSSAYRLVARWLEREGP